MWRNAHVLLVTLILSLFQISHANTNVTVDLNTQRFIGGESELDRDKYFNIHATFSGNQVTQAELNRLVNELNVNFGRSFWSPFSAYSGNAPYPNESFARNQGPTNIRNTKNHPNYSFFSNRNIVTDHPSKVFSPGDSPTEMAAWAANYFKYYFDDTTRPLFYEPMNEPFVHSEEFGIDSALARRQMTEIFKEIGRKFKQENINTKVIGYSSAWPSMELWDFRHFNERMKYFMDVAGPHVDSFSVHPYDGVNVTGANSQRSGSNLEAILDLMETYSHYKWQNVKPITISEYGGIEKGYGNTYSDIKSVQSVRSINNMLFQLLNRQDRLLTSIPFITGKSAWHYNAGNNWEPYGGAILRPDKNSIQNGRPTRFFWTPRIHFYELWANVKGQRVKIGSDNVDIQTQAFVDGNKAYVALNSLAENNEIVDLRFVNAMGNVTGVRRKLLKIYPNAQPIYRDQQVSSPSSIELIPGETVVLEYTFSETISLSNREDVTTYYAREHLQTIAANRVLTFNFSNVDVAAGQSILKLAMSRAHNRSKQPQVRVNGTIVNVPGNWMGGDQTSRNDFFGALHIPFNNTLLQRNNSVEIIFPDGGGRVSSVVLDVHNGEDVGEDLISFANVITTIPSATRYDISLNYSASTRRDLVVEMWKENNYLTSAKTTVNEGSGTSVISVDVNTAPQVGETGYLFKASIRPVNTGWRENIDATKVENIRVVAYEDTFSFANNISTLPSASQYTFNVNYSAATSRDLVIEFWDNNWLASGKTTVESGSGTAQVSVNLPRTLQPGSGGYIVKGRIAPVNSDWRAAIDTAQLNNISISGGLSSTPTPTPQATPQPTPTSTPTPTAIPNPAEPGQPGNGNALIVPGRVQAEDYVNYADTTTGNAGGQYRSDNVDIQQTTDTGGGFNVGWTETNEWLEYPLDVNISGNYSANVRVASAPGNARFSLVVDGNSTDVVNVGNTGGWQNWQTQSASLGQLNAGRHTLRVQVQAGGFNLNWIDLNREGGNIINGDQCNFTAQCKTLFGDRATDCANSQSNQSVCMCGSAPCQNPDATPVPTATPIPTATPTPTPPPPVFGGGPAPIIEDGAVLQAENFDTGGQGSAYNDANAANNGGAYRPTEGVDLQTTTDTGGGFIVGWTADGEWLNYTVNTTSGIYDISARVASAVANPGDLHVQIGNGNTFADLGTFAVENTGGWQRFETLSLNRINVSGGQQVLRLRMIGGNFNINWLAFNRSGNANVTTAIADGGWGVASTWSDGVPSATKRAIIPQGRTVTLWGGNPTAKGVVVQGTLNVGEQAGANFSLTSDWVHVNSNGVFNIGSASNPYDEGLFTLTLTGTDPLADWNIETANGSMQINDNNGFLMAAGGGRLQFYGDKKLTFTRLAATAPVGANKIYVRNIIERNYDGDYSAASDGALNWSVGDQIVIASSSNNYAHEEVRTISSVVDLGNTNTELTLDSPLNYRHYGERETYSSGSNSRTIEMRAEVAVLNRNVKIQGLASQDTDNSFGDRARFNTGSSQGVGGHIMVMGSAGGIVLDSVQLDRMGQTGRLGRYPMHWHLAGDRTGDMLRGVSITNSNNRGVTVHGTHNLLIQDVVLHDIHGHGFFMEDAVETGNTFLSNIAFGIHKVGRSDRVGDRAPDVNDPFIVDTHDHVGQNPTRFLSSAAYWMTNPDNTWRGNISAGADGTGFWFLFPSSAIGAAANDPQYANVVPDKVNLREFAFNSTHSSQIGLNVDRGSDIEGPVGANLLPNWNGDEYNPPREPQFENFTAYKHTVGIYHRGRVGNFVNNKFADNFNSTFITFTQRLTNALYVGHSRGNADRTQIVTGHTFYDGANTLDGTHFAGFAASNAHMFRSAAIAARNTHFVMRNSSYENDGSANHMSFVNPQGGNSYQPLGKSAPSVIYDEDGTLTRHVGGRAGSTIIPNHPYYYDNADRLPSGWNARVSDNRYALMRMGNVNGSNAMFRVTTPDGDSASNAPGSGQFSGTNALVKMNGGEYTVDFPSGVNSISGGFDISFFVRTGPTDGSTIVRFAGIGNRMTVTNHRNAGNLAALRNANSTSYARVGNDLYVKFFTLANPWNKVNFRIR